MRTYSATERADAVALASTVGPVKAAAELGIPKRNVARWMHRPEHSPIIRAAEATIAERLAVAHEKALAAVMAGLDDPKARLGDKATALRVLGEQRLLAEGRATARTESMSMNVDITAGLSDAQRDELRDAIDATLAARQAEDAILALPDPTATLDRPTIQALIAAIERRLGHA